jgi:hypothetical protein
MLKVMSVIGNTDVSFLFFPNVPKVEGAKTNTPSKTNTYKRLPITNTLLP